MNRKKPGKDPTEPPSKTQLKREMLELQELGESLIDLPESELAELALPDRLLSAVRDAKKMSKRGALHRQKQFIGKVMRTIDATPLREALVQRENRARTAVARLHIVEKWRDRLLGEGDAALKEFIDEQPAADRQHIRQLVRSASAERKRDAPPRASRLLFAISMN